MSIPKGKWVHATLLSFMILAVAFSISAETPVVVSAAGVVVQPTYVIHIPQRVQNDIWNLCAESQLSFELVLAIFQVDDISDFRTANVKAEVASLVQIRDYWVDQGFSNEGVFVLMLLSRQRGIEGCILFMDNNDSADHDPYVQQVTQYKHTLEQSLSLYRSL